jgi:hypothetical protein
MTKPKIRAAQFKAIGRQRTSTESPAAARGEFPIDGGLQFLDDEAQV